MEKMEARRIRTARRILRQYGPANARRLLIAFERGANLAVLQPRYGVTTRTLRNWRTVLTTSSAEYRLYDGVAELAHMSEGIGVSEGTDAHERMSAEICPGVSARST